MDSSFKNWIYVIRHGSTALDDTNRSDGRLDLPLSDEGRAQVVAALDHLRRIPITCIYAAPQKRTKETAEILQSGIFSEPEIELAKETITWNPGDAGERKDRNKEMIRYLLAHPKVKPANGESYATFCNRFDKWLDKMKGESASEGPLLLVESGSCNRRISERIFNDRKILNVTEAGLYLLFKDGDDWTASIIDNDGDTDEHDS